MKQLIYLAFYFALFPFTLLSQTTANYKWENVKIGGGGFVSGVITCPQQQDLLFVRTDVGGAYRWQPQEQSWKPLLDWVPRSQSTFLGIESIAIDPSSPNKVYMAAGLYTLYPRAILYSDDYGDSFHISEVPFQINGNGMGRSNGERLAVDPNNGNILFYGSRDMGLWKSSNGARTWQRVSSFPIEKTENRNGICMVFFDESSSNGQASQRIFVGVSRKSESNFYFSEDAGETWKPLPGHITEYMPQRYAKSDNQLYITYADNDGPHNLKAGDIYQVDLKTFEWKRISPEVGLSYGGISVDRQDPRRIIATTMNRYDPQNWKGGVVNGDRIYRSSDGGNTWENICETGLKAENGAYTWITETPQLHWAGDIKLDPYHSGKAYIISGNGVFMTEDIFETPVVTWNFFINNLEETVPLDLVSISGGPLVSVLGDYDGYIHTRLDVPMKKRISANLGTTEGVDFAQSNPRFIVVSGEKDPCISISEDGGETWKGVKNKPDERSRRGYVAVSADGETIYWYPQRSKTIYYSKNKGKTWLPVHTKTDFPARPFTDRVNPNKMYCYSEGRLHILTYNKDSKTHDHDTIDLPDNGSQLLRLNPIREGEIWFAGKENGLYRISTAGKKVESISTLSYCQSVGLGKPAPGEDHFTLFVYGNPAGEAEGIYRSDNEGASWIRINDEQHQYGGPGNGDFIVGDMNVYGRVYMSTAGRGLIYGEIK